MMKNLKLFGILMLMVIVSSCSSDDDGGSVPTAAFNATIDGATFNNYTATLGFYDASSSDGTLTIAITDSNSNVIRLFMNSTGGLGSGVVKQIGDVDANNFSTTVIIRDQAAAVTYTSINGSLTITENRESPQDPSARLTSGSFDVTAATNTGDTVSMTGTWSNMEHF